jgi:hypothetical protein
MPVILGRNLRSLHLTLRQGKGAASTPIRCILRTVVFHWAEEAQSGTTTVTVVCCTIIRGQRSAGIVTRFANKVSFFAGLRELEGGALGWPGAIAEDIVDSVVGWLDSGQGVNS